MIKHAVATLQVTVCLLLCTLVVRQSPIVPVVDSPNALTTQDIRHAAVSGYPLPGASAPTEADFVQVPPEQIAAEQLISRAPVAGLTPNTYLIADIAVDADYAFYQKFGGNLANAEQYVRNLLADVNKIYSRDLHIVLNVSFIRISTTPSEPWTATSLMNALTQVQNYWISHEASRARTTVLFLSGKLLGGGVAYVPSLCSNTYSYAVVGNVVGNHTTYPSDYTWDLVSTAHELGHNFGSQHSHCYRKANGAWYDQCYSGEQGCFTGTPLASRGTIMSYCHINSPYMSNVNPISFVDDSHDPVMVNVIRSYAESRVVEQQGGCLKMMQKKVFIPLTGNNAN